MFSIYKITNLTNNKIYIGQTINDIEFRFKQHLRENRGPNKLHFDMQHQNSEDFTIVLIDKSDDPKEADEKERFWISFYNSTDPDIGYNLDNGGKSGCSKYAGSLDKMKLTSKNNWLDEEKAAKMLEALRRGTESWRKICEDKRLPFNCPICGKIEYLPKHKLKNRKTCGNHECKVKFANQNNSYMAGILKANYLNSIYYKQKSDNIRRLVVKWGEDNKDIVTKCPKNKIIPTLNGLITIVQDEFGIKDIRTISKACCGTNSKRKFLEWLKDSIK